MSGLRPTPLSGCKRELTAFEKIRREQKEGAEATTLHSLIEVAKGLVQTGKITYLGGVPSKETLERSLLKGYHEACMTDETLCTNLHSNDSQHHPAYMPLYSDIAKLKKMGVKTDLYEHQLQGLQWMIDGENREALEKQGNVRGVWKHHGSKGWVNTVSGQCSTKPSLPRGGIVADDKGLAPKLSVIALCVLGLEAEEHGSARRATLIVTPTKEIAEVWISRIKDHCDEKVRFFHYSTKARRDLHPSQAYKLEFYNFVITTYSTLKLDYKDFQESISDPVYTGEKKFPLFQIKWTRVVNDEGQDIRNRETVIFNAMCKLKTDRRWARVATHFVNHLEDVGSLLIWIKVDPFTLYEGKWTALVEKIAAKNVSAMAIRDELFKEYILKRTATTTDSNRLPLLPVAPPNEETIMVDLTREDQALYAAFMLATNLTRMRQVCCDKRLLKKVDSHLTVSDKKSAKVIEFARIVEKRLHEFPSEKILVYTYFEEMVPFLKRELNPKGIRHVSYTGKTSRSEKAYSIERFKEPLQSAEGELAPQVMLLTYGTGSDELNLTEATCVILYDPWWNSLNETKAIQRASQLGQKKAVKVYRLITTNTIEVYEANIQLKKKWGAEQGFAEKSVGMDCNFEDLHYANDKKRLFEMDGSVKKRKLEDDTSSPSRQHFAMSASDSDPDSGPDSDSDSDSDSSPLSLLKGEIMIADSDSDSDSESIFR